MVRIIDTGGAIHQVVVMGDQFCDDGGEVAGTHGFCIDVTSTSTNDSEDLITAKVTEIAERRSTIDQTKGMLMSVYSINEVAAFNLLKSLSRIHNMKLGLLAQQIATCVHLTRGMAPPRNYESNP
jgi:ANTAR domain